MNIENYIRPDGTVDFRDAWLMETVRTECAWKFNPNRYDEKPIAEEIVEDVMDSSWMVNKVWKLGFTYKEVLEAVELLAAQTIERWEEENKEESTNE